MKQEKPIRCYTYVRVSTAIQIEGYSIDAQHEELREYACRNNMTIVHEYEDAGKSGKNIKGREGFTQMLDDIQSGKDNVSYVLVFKLSRFGRNAADIMNSIQLLEDYGVNLHCVKDGLDTANGLGAKLLIPILAAVSEMERENIRIQTLAGRHQKAREGKWNGGFAPYGYTLENGELKIADDEKDVIVDIFKLYTTTNMGATAIAKYLNNHYEKKVRQRGTLPAFSSSFVKKVIENPVYCGKLAYGRRQTEKIQGTRNEYHIVQQTEFPIFDGIHDAIVSEEVWKQANRKKKANGVKREKTHSLEHEHILSGLLRCPECGSAMYGNVARKKKPDGSNYKDIFYYYCKRRKVYDGKLCEYKRNLNQEKINAAVEEILLGLVTNPAFADLITQKINSKIDLTQIDAEIAQAEKRHRKLVFQKDKIISEQDALDVLDSVYEMKYDDLQKRLDEKYHEIADAEEEIAVLKGRRQMVEQEKATSNNVYTILKSFNKLYKKFTDGEKKEFMNSFISEIQVFRDEQPNDQWIKSISFNFPVIVDGQETQRLDLSGLDSGKTVETVVLMSRKVT